MFSFLSTSSTQGGQPSTVLIKEANEHVRQMHARVVDLEKRVREQSELLERRNLEHHDQLHRLKVAKDNELSAFQRQYEKIEQRCHQLEAMVREREVQIAYLMHRCSYLDEAASYAPLIEQLAHCLKTSLASPPPKVHSARSAKVNHSSKENHSTIAEESIKNDATEQ